MFSKMGEADRGKVEGRGILDADQRDPGSQPEESSQSCSLTSEDSAAGEFIHSPPPESVLALRLLSLRIYRFQEGFLPCSS